LNVTPCSASQWKWATLGPAGRRLERRRRARGPESDDEDVRFEIEPVDFPNIASA
jgi:hypothetical protein